MSRDVFGDRFTVITSSSCFSPFLGKDFSSVFISLKEGIKILSSPCSRSTDEKGEGKFFPTRTGDGMWYLFSLPVRLYLLHTHLNQGWKIGGMRLSQISLQLSLSLSPRFLCRPPLNHFNAHGQPFLQVEKGTTQQDNKVEKGRKTRLESLFSSKEIET